MKRLSACTLTWFVLAISLAEAVPVRRLYEPESPKNETVSLVGTTWVGQDFSANYRITFESDGTMTYGANHAKNRGGSWKLVGHTLYFEMNKKYREFEGTVSGDILQGNSWNITGKRWQTFLQRVPTK